nr:hypothetical protein [uncultured Variovorax sp.]
MIAPTRSTPLAPACSACTVSVVARKAFRVLRAIGTTARPAAVIRMPRTWRSNNGVPSRPSMSARACVAAGWLMPICSAARRTLPESATATSSCRCRRRAFAISRA